MGHARQSVGAVNTLGPLRKGPCRSYHGPMTGDQQDPIRPPSAGGQPRDHRLQRLFVVADLAPGNAVDCADAQANYLLNVLRLREGARVLVFNGRDGEWIAEIAGARKRTCALCVVERVRAQSTGPLVDYLFAPLKHARLDYMVQKATEMGVARFRPVMTHRTIAERVNLERMRSNVIEAAEQCGVLQVPEVFEPIKLMAALAAWPADRPLIVCDEGANVANPLSQLAAASAQSGEVGRVGVLIGPEGGFDPQERDHILARDFVVPISLGPRIMRADTAAVAALALVNAAIGGGW
jgi:16S rRNA (uracil1498-N3)-methyltransferase